MKILRSQLAGLALIAGLGTAAMTGCKKETIITTTVRSTSSVLMDVPADTTGLSGDEEVPKFPPHGHGPRLGTNGIPADSIGVDGSGDEEVPKFPPHK